MTMYRDLIKEDIDKQNKKDGKKASNVDAVVSKPIDLKNVICPQCGKPFKLVWESYGEERHTLILRGCPSGGIYDVTIGCPHCDYEEELSYSWLRCGCGNRSFGCS